MTGTDLDRYISAKALNLMALRERTDWRFHKGPRPGFQKALEAAAASGMGFIAEYKRASPSLGDINLSLTPEEAASHYRRADCLSVLTE